MRILFLTQYYPPESGAPQNRLHSLARNLKKQGVEVEVLTCFPNYPDGKIFKDVKKRWFDRDEIDGIPITRTWVLPSQSLQMFKRLVCYFSFMFSAAIVGLFRTRRADVIVCESPPLFLGLAGVLLSWLRWSKLIFNVSDLWPESVEKLGITNRKWVLAPAYWLEAFIYKRSNLVTGQTQGIVANIKGRFPKAEVFWLPNGIDRETFVAQTELSLQWRLEQGYQPNDYVVMYAGVLGNAQKLKTIIEAAELIREKSIVHVAIVGDGPERGELMAAAARLGNPNLRFFGRQDRSFMPVVVGACDAFVVPLRKLDLFKGAIPSKVFEPLALGKPIILGVDGEARELFIDEANAGIYFEPENAEHLANAIVQLEKDRHAAGQYAKNGQDFVFDKFDRSRLAAEFQRKISESLIGES